MWSNNAIANGVGHWAWLTGNNNLGGGLTGSSAVFTQDVDVALGFLFFGDTDRGTATHIRGPSDTVSRWLTFDTGDGRMALLSHGSGDNHIRQTTNNFNIGTGSDTINVGIRVTDPDGLYIDSFHSLTFHGGATNQATAGGSRELNGGGYDIVKAEDGALILRRIVTNVNNFIVRDGVVELYMDSGTVREGNPLVRPSIGTIVIGVAPGVVDRGEAHPLNPGWATTNIGEGTVRDRTQWPIFRSPATTTPTRPA